MSRFRLSRVGCPAAVRGEPDAGRQGRPSAYGPAVFGARLPCVPPPVRPAHHTTFAARTVAQTGIFRAASSGEKKRFWNCKRFARCCSTYMPQSAWPVHGIPVIARARLRSRCLGRRRWPPPEDLWAGGGSNFTAFGPAGRDGRGGFGGPGGVRGASYPPLYF